MVAGSTVSTDVNVHLVGDLEDCDLTLALGNARSPLKGGRMAGQALAHFRGAKRGAPSPSPIKLCQSQDSIRPLTLTDSPPEAITEVATVTG
jgi:hypothetical protein